MLLRRLPASHPALISSISKKDRCSAAVREILARRRQTALVRLQESTCGTHKSATKTPHYSVHRAGTVITFCSWMARYCESHSKCPRCALHPGFIRANDNGYDLGGIRAAESNGYPHMLLLIHSAISHD